MPARKAITFKCPPTMQTAMADIMETWKLDRTSVIKLGVFLLNAYLQREEIRNLTLHELVESLESLTPPGFPDYEHFVNE